MSLHTTSRIWNVCFVAFLALVVLGKTSALGGDPGDKEVGLERQVDMLNRSVRTLQEDNRRLRERLDLIESLPMLKGPIKVAAQNKEREEQDRDG